MDLLVRPRIGIVVPPRNPVAEPEFNQLVGAELNVYTARFPATPGMALRRMLETYNEVLADTLGAFAGMPLDAAVVACSGSHYLLDPDGDRAFCDELSARAGFHVLSATQAILAACAALGVTRLTLVSPYEPWLTDVSHGFWEKAGLTVVDTVPVPASRTPEGDEHYDPYEVTTEMILQRIGSHRFADDSAVLFTGTGMGTLAAATAIAREDDRRTLLTSNLASAWWARRTVGRGPGETHPLLRRLTRTAAA